MFNKMVEAHFRANYSKLAKRYRRSLNSDQLAEDVVQEAYARCIQYQKNWNPDQPFEPWFSIILRNAFRDQLSMERGIVFEEINEFEHETEDTTRIDELRDAVERQMTKENPRHQSMLKLFFIDGYTGKEISEITEFTQSNVRKTVQMFRQRFLKRYT